MAIGAVWRYLAIGDLKRVVWRWRSVITWTVFCQAHFFDVCKRQVEIQRVDGRRMFIKHVHSNNIQSSSYMVNIQ